MHTTNPTITTKLFLQLNSTSLFLPYLFIKSFTNTLFFYTSALFSIPFFAYSDPYNLNQKYFPYLCYLVHFRLRQETSEQRSLARTDTVLISLFLPKIRTGITVTDSLSLKLRKLVYCR